MKYLNPDFSDREFWNSLERDEFYRYGDKIPKIHKHLSTLVNGTSFIVNLMCGKESHIKSNVGIDISENMLKKNKGIAGYFLHDVNDESKDYPLPEGIASHVIMVSGMAYLDFPEHTFEQSYRILKEGGVFVSAFDHCFNAKCRPWWFNMNMDQRLYFVEETMEKIGFHDISRTQEMIDYGLDPRPGFGPRPFYFVKGEK